MGGTYADRLKRQLNESPDEKQARLLTARTAKKQSRASASEQQKAAEITQSIEWKRAQTLEWREAHNLKSREQHKGAMSVQEATHALIAKFFPRDDAMLDQAKLEI